MSVFSGDKTGFVRLDHIYIATVKLTSDLTHAYTALMCVLRFFSSDLQGSMVHVHACSANWMKDYHM